MNTSRFYKKLTQAEVGQTKTHEVYIRMPNDFDYEKFFNNTHIKNGSVIEVNFTAPTVSKKNPTISQQEYDYRFVFFANSNKEKRIPGLGPLFKAFEVEDGDVVCLERVGEGENVKFAVTFYNAEQVQVSPAAVIITSEQQGDELSRISTPLIEEPLQIIYYGAPGTGKSHKIDNDPHVTDENTIRTTFHPDSDYSTFVGAYKPTMAPMPVNAFVGTTVHHAKNADNEKAYEKKIVYKYVPQAFLKAYVAAWSDLDNPHFLVIEEINRGNCAQIFGDLFQLLDRNNTGSSSYAIHADEDITQFLAEDKNGFANLSEEQKDAIRSFVLIKDSGKAEAIGDAILSGKKLLLPPNLYIWATMNTSDQSLFPIDSAFKRRWNWEYMPIDYDAMNWQFEAGGKRYLWSDFLKKMNPLIYNLTQSSDKQMGYFFAKADKKTDDT
ncbi:AAA family ATPase, partial [Bacteroides acidifaciens]|uniref:AAA family ATPase n=1 Tax=Bacteroides acidifaciens TaxID=85831 RepID=UPI0026752999